MKIELYDAAKSMKASRENGNLIVFPSVEGLTPVDGTVPDPVPVPE